MKPTVATPLVPLKSKAINISFSTLFHSLSNEQVFQFIFGSSKTLWDTPPNILKK